MAGPRRPPAAGLLLGAAAMVPVPILAGALAAWALYPAWAGLAARLSVLWAATILIFLAGIRRGLSFRQPGGATGAQLGGTAAGLGVRGRNG
jgi:hypothetical protein